MYNNYDYPCGADGPDAPWNQSDPEPVEVEVVINQTLSKSTKIFTTDYIVNEWEDFEPDEEGRFYRTGGIEYDFSDSDLKGAYEEQDYTIPELLDYLKAYLIVDIANCDKESGKKQKLQHILDCCEDWEVIETEVIEN